MADIKATSLGGVPKGTTAQRPTSPAVGDVFYNGDLGYMEMYTAQGWFAATPINPGIPTSVVATNSGSSRAFNNGRASVAFNVGTDGGLPTSFTVTSSPGSYTASGSTSPLVVTGLQSSTQYTYAVTATNNFGTSLSSSASSAITATTVPQAPSVSAIVANQSAPLTITPGATGGSAITGYSIVSNPVTTTQTTSNTSYVFTGLTNDTAYTFTVTATNSNGTSLSSSSNSVTPSPYVTADYLVVAGGGGGGGDLGGGGGAGGLRSTVTATGGGGSLESALSLGIGNTYTVTVGAGGTAGPATRGGSRAGAGGNSSISGSGITTITSVGGGYSVGYYNAISNYALGRRGRGWRGRGRLAPPKRTCEHGGCLPHLPRHR